MGARGGHGWRWQCMGCQCVVVVVVVVVLLQGKIRSQKKRRKKRFFRPTYGLGLPSRKKHAVGFVAGSCTLVYLFIFIVRRRVHACASNKVPCGKQRPYLCGTSKLSITARFGPARRLSPSTHGVRLGQHTDQPTGMLP